MNASLTSLAESEGEKLNNEKETIPNCREIIQELRFFIKTIFIQHFNVIEAENGIIGLEKSKKYASGYYYQRRDDAGERRH